MLGHWGRKFYDVHESTNAPITKEALDRIGKLYDVERTISDKTKERRQIVRDIKSRPSTNTLKSCLEAKPTSLCRMSPGQPLKTRPRIRDS